MAAGKSNFAFFEGKIVPIDDAKVSVTTHALHYGTGVFGGIRGYWNAEQEQLFIFRVLDHCKRLKQSASLLRIEIPYTIEELAQILVELLRAERFHENCYIRPLAYKAGEYATVGLNGIEDGLAIFARPFGRLIPNDDGAHVHFSAWRRIDDNAIPARGKISGAYVNSSLIKADAQLAGYDDALVLNNDGHVAEASVANLMIIRDGTVITPPITANILEGITRRTMIRLLRDDLGVEVLERQIDRTEVYLADEIFICGTGAQIAAITRVEHRPIGSATMGPITKKLRDLYFDVVTGRVEKYRDWLLPVYAAEHLAANRATS